MIEGEQEGMYSERQPEAGSHRALSVRVRSQILLYYRVVSRESAMHLQRMTLATWWKAENSHTRTRGRSVFSCNICAYNNLIKPC